MYYSNTYVGDSFTAKKTSDGEKLDLVSIDDVISFVYYLLNSTHKVF